MTLSPEQQTVVDLDSTVHAVVIAGPGTGKTHLLANRVRSLLERDLQPSQILVLSFSRTAVAEARHRLKQIGEAAEFVRVRTLDSLASSLLSFQLELSGGTTNSTTSEISSFFDARIEAATRFLIEDPTNAGNALTYRHLIVDEMQDVVGIRAAFVESLLSLNNVGFTILGDPAQGIYAFQMTEEQRESGIPDLLTRVRSRFGDNLRVFTLQTNYRARFPVKKLSDIGSRLSASNGAYETLLADLKQVVQRLPEVPTLGSLVRMLHNPGTHAVLCSNGGDALYLSRELHRNQVRHQLLSEAQEQRWSRWIGTVLKAMPATSVSKATFCAAYPREAAEQWMDSEVAWTEFRRMARSRDFHLTLSAVVRGMRFDRPNSLSGLSTGAKVLVSTVHRAKGLEFDSVYVYELPQAFGTVEDQSKTCFVALTRTKGKTFRIAKQNTPFMTAVKPSGRWRVPASRFGKSWFATRELEICVSDSADGLMPPGGREGPALSLQQYLFTKVNEGDPLLLRSLFLQESGCCDYGIFHNGIQIGVVAGVDIRRALHGNRVGYEMPSEIQGLFVESVESVAGIAGAAEQCGLGRLDVWLRVLLNGLGTLTWPTSRTVGESNL